MQFDEDKFRALTEGEPVRPEPRGFQPEQLIACPACERRNAPTRLNCLYCGEDLPPAEAADGDLRRPVLRPLEEREQGFNVVLLPATEPSLTLDDEHLAEVASLLKLEPTPLAEMLGVKQTPLPLARAATRDEAELAGRRLVQLGLLRRGSVRVVSDEELAVDSAPPRRIRQLELGEAALSGRARADEAAESLRWEDVALLVAGRIRHKRIETDERGGKLPGAERTIVESREFHEDENVLDIYARDSVRNWRVAADGFDYSCLGSRRGLLVAENFNRLIEALCERAPNAAFDENYGSLRHLLRCAWPPAEQTSSGGLRRTRPGRFMTETVLSVSNERQFTRYGRLLNHFLTRAEEGRPG